MPQFGFLFNQQTYSLRDSIVLCLSHSGGTFASLACCNLLRGFTSHIFAVTSDWDTQVARAVRGGVELQSQYVFSTFAGFRPAEPCSVSVVAMHHLLSHLLIYVMGYAAHLDAVSLSTPASSPLKLSPTLELSSGSRSVDEASSESAESSDGTTRLPQSEPAEPTTASGLGYTVEEVSCALSMHEHSSCPTPIPNSNIPLHCFSAHCSGARARDSEAMPDKSAHRDRWLKQIRRHAHLGSAAGAGHPLGAACA